MYGRLPRTNSLLTGGRKKKVYLCGRALCEDGSEVTVSTTGDANLMEKLGETSYQKYIYPRHFFSLPEGTRIEALYFYFTNEDGSIVVRDTSGEDFLVSQSEE